MNCPCSRPLQQVVFQGAKKQSWKGSVALCGISPSCVYKAWRGEEITRRSSELKLRAQRARGQESKAALGLLSSVCASRADTDIWGPQLCAN